jgi:hypothetical protein
MLWDIDRKQYFHRHWYESDQTACTKSMAGETLFSLSLTLLVKTRLGNLAVSWIQCHGSYN